MTFGAVKLGRVARTISGTGFPPAFQGNSAGEVPFIKVSDLALDANRAGVEAANNWVSRSDLKVLGGRVAPAGSIVFPKVGAALLGNVRARLLRPSAMDNNLMAVVPTGGDSRFWFYALSSIDLGEFSPGGPLPYVTDSQVRELQIPMPPLDEQRRIADFLDTETARLDQLLDARQSQAALLSQRRGALLLSLVGGREDSRVPSGLEWMPTVPAHWSTVRLTLLARLGSGHTPSRSHPEWWVDPTIPWITTGEVAQVRDDRLETLTETRETISRLGLANSAAEIHPRGTVVLSRTASVGYSAVMGVDMATSQDFATWTCGPRLEPYFLLWTLRAMHPWLVGARAMGSTHKTIYMPDIQALRIPVPPLTEQHVIVDEIRSRLGHLDQVHDALDAQALLVRERRQALITAAVNGQIDVSTAQGGRS